MELKKQLEDKIFDMEKVAIAFDIEPFDIYFLGGATCILGEYTEREMCIRDRIEHSRLNVHR